jgi:hypothetical protein
MQGDYHNEAFTCHCADGAIGARPATTCQRPTSRSPTAGASCAPGRTARSGGGWPTRATAPRTRPPTLSPQRRTDGALGIIGYNDAKGRTAADVASVLREAASDLYATY